MSHVTCMSTSVLVRFIVKLYMARPAMEDILDDVHVTMRACITMPRQLMHSAAVRPSTHGKLGLISIGCLYIVYCHLYA